MATNPELFFLRSWQFNYRRTELRSPHFMIKVTIRQVCPPTFLSPPRTNDSVNCQIWMERFIKRKRYSHFAYWGVGIDVESREKSICYLYQSETHDYLSHRTHSTHKLQDLEAMQRTNKPRGRDYLQGLGDIWERGRMKDCTMAMRTTRALKCPQWLWRPEMKSGFPLPEPTHYHLQSESMSEFLPPRFARR